MAYGSAAAREMFQFYGRSRTDLARETVVGHGGTHLLVEMWESPFSTLADASVIRAILARLRDIVDLPARGEGPDVHVYQFNPYGVSGSATNQLANILIHTWPENLYAAIDIFARDREGAYRILDALKGEMNPGHLNVLELQRGQLMEMEDT